MMSACEILDLASSGLYIASQRLDDDASKEIRTKVINASKDVLQGTMKVSLYIYAELLHSVKIFTKLFKMIFNEQNIHKKLHSFRFCLSLMMQRLEKWSVLVT